MAQDEGGDFYRGTVMRMKKLYYIIVGIAQRCVVKGAPSLRWMSAACILATTGSSWAQTTGEQASPLLLVTPVMAEQSYLASSDGEVIQVWPSTLLPSGPGRMDANGTLLRVDKDRLPASFNAPGGTGGRIAKTSRNGASMWSFSIATGRHLVHHDALELPNGNILALVWQRHEPSEAEAKGRNKDRLDRAGLWSECLWELRPEGTRNAKLVWEWKAWDHVRRVPEGALPRHLRHFEPGERIDINGGRTSAPAWAGVTRMEYQPELDQILLTAGGLGSVWIVDHSTTTHENAGDIGGKGGKGGRLLYQWNGMTAALKSGGDHAFVVDAEWSLEPEGGEPALEILRGVRGKGGALSYVIERWKLPLRDDGSYAMQGSGEYLPPTLVQSDPVELRDSREIQERPTGFACGPNGAWALTMGYAGRTRWSVAEGQMASARDYRNNMGRTSLRISAPASGAQSCCGASSPGSPAKAGKDTPPLGTFTAAPVLKSRLVAATGLPAVSAAGAMPRVPAPGSQSIQAAASTSNPTSLR